MNGGWREVMRGGGQMEGGNERLGERIKEGNERWEERMRYGRAGRMVGLRHLLHRLHITLLSTEQPILSLEAHFTTIHRATRLKQPQ